MKLNVEETLNTIKFSELAQKGYKVMSNSEFDRIVEGVIQLQQENQQLKEQLIKLEDKYIHNVPCCNEEDCDLFKEHQLYKSILDEIREKIESTCICDYEGAICFIDEILQILDKVKE